MTWIDQPSYIGPDRREHAKGWRLIERRKRSLLVDAPTLPAALRRLKLSLIDVTSEESSTAFARLAQAYAGRARTLGRSDIAGVLDRLVVFLNTPQVIEGDRRPAIDAALVTCGELLVQRPMRDNAAAVNRLRR